MSNYYNVYLNVLAASANELTHIAAGLQGQQAGDLPFTVSNNDATSVQIPATNLNGIPEGSANTVEPAGDNAAQDPYLFPFELGKAGGDWESGFNNRFPAHYFEYVLNHILRISSRFPCAILVLGYFDPLSYNGTLVIHAGEVVQAVCDDKRMSHTVQWALPDVAAPYKTEYINGVPFGSLWNQWLADLTAAVQQLKPLP